MTPARMSEIYSACFPDRPWTETEFIQLLTRDDVVCISDDYGFLLVSTFPPEAEIITIAVTPEQRRKGFAEALFQTFWSKKFEPEIDTIFLEVSETNVAARALYEKLHFQEVGRRKAYYSRQGLPPEDAVVMKRSMT